MSCLDSLIHRLTQLRRSDEHILFADELEYARFGELIVRGLIHSDQH